MHPSKTVLRFPGNGAIKELVFSGSLDLPELQHEAFVSSYQPEFLTHEPLVDTDLQHLKSPSQCSPMQSSD